MALRHKYEEKRLNVKLLKRKPRFTTKVASNHLWVNKFPLKKELPAAYDSAHQPNHNRPKNEQYYSTISISLPQNVHFHSYQAVNQIWFIVEGPRGKLWIHWNPRLRFEDLSGTETRQLLLSCPTPDDYSLYLALVGAIYRMVVGVTVGYKERLKLVGVGYKTFEERKLLRLVLGYSHGSFYKLKSTVTPTFGRKNNRLFLQGVSLPLISGSAADLHNFKKPDIYRGKGVRYWGVKLPQKEGKKKK